MSAGGRPNVALGLAALGLVNVAAWAYVAHTFPAMFEGYNTLAVFLALVGATFISGLLPLTQGWRALVVVAGILSTVLFVCVAFFALVLVLQSA